MGCPSWEWEAHVKDEEDWRIAACIAESKKYGLGSVIMRGDDCIDRACFKTCPILDSGKLA